ncbi:hypothetical protein DRJ17_05515 [Candidatus Woesearchaeota archaeon]|nr:MAG: hypothetical protein DRJ17_05515 [Candidatus Woesearchaeota archaeon]
MAVKLNPIEIRNLGTYGLIREASVDDNLIPDGAVVEAKNVHFDRIGAVTLRLGISNLHGTVSAGYPCLGVHNAFHSTLLVVFSDGTNNDIYCYHYQDPIYGTYWGKSLEDDTKDAKTRFVDFAGRTIRVNGVDSSIRVWTGVDDGPSYWEYSGDPINPQQLWNDDDPIKPKFIEVFKSRVYLAGDSKYPDRLFFSTVIDSSGNISWLLDTNYVDINPKDGENITALKRYSLELLIFKPNYIYRFRTSGVDPDPLIKIGTRSQESVIEGKKGLYFHHDTGFYRYSGGYPVEISKPILDFVENISYSNYEDICAWKDNDHIYWSVGDVTINGETWKNVVLRYTESTEVWTVYSYAYRPTWAGEYDDGYEIRRIFGADNGVVYKLDDGYTDDGEPIGYYFITKWYELGSILDRKVIQEIVALMEKSQASKVMYQIDDESKWKDLGQTQEFLTYFKNLNQKCYRIRFKLAGISRVEPFIFKGFIISECLNEGKIEKL